MEINHIHPDEPVEETMKFIEANRNWSVEKQAYKVPECKAQLSECNIYQRGMYLILEHNGIIHYWERISTNYPFFQMAIDFMEPDIPKKWKTCDRLIALREAIRQTEVNHCGYVEDILKGRTMTQVRYNLFMRLSRAQDLEHHGQHTF